MAKIINLPDDNRTELEVFIEEYIKKNKITSDRFPEDAERHRNVPMNINIASLYESIRMSSVGQARNKSVTEHFEVFVYVMKTLTELNVEFELSNIFIKTGEIAHLAPQKMKELGITEQDASANHIPKVIGRIDILDCMDEDRNLAIGIGYDEKSTVMVFGTNITVCQNMSVFGDNFMTTRGRDAMKLDTILDKIKDLIGTRKAIWDENNRVLNKMKDVELEYDSYLRFFGWLSHNAVGKAYFQKNWPFSIAKTSEYSKKVWEEHKDMAIADMTMTLYELYNHGTFVLTHQAKINDVWGDLQLFGNLFTEYFDLI